MADEPKAETTETPGAAPAVAAPENPALDLLTWIVARLGNHPEAEALLKRLRPTEAPEA